ncbi:MAG: DUF1015 domain-containing protein [bacterium]
MITVKPFKGICYNAEKIKDFSLVLTPPYDIIDQEMQDKLYNSHPYNFVKIDFGKTYPSDNDIENVYTRSRQLFENWLKENVLIEDPEECFYILRQDFEAEGKGYSRLGFYGAYRLTEFSKDTIMPHEKTQSGPKENRYKLTKSCGSYFSAVFSIYEDRAKTIERLYAEGKFGEPYITFIDYQGVKNLLYKSKDANVNKLISEMMSDKRLFIADGHHRYETALRISKELPDNEKAQYTLMYFSNTLNEGLIVLPTHRLLSEINYDNDAFEQFANRYFDVVKFSLDHLKECVIKLREAKQNHAFAVLTKSDIFLLTLKSIKDVNVLFPAEMHATLRELDVNILFYVLIKGFFGVTEEDVKNQERISYTKDAEDALNKVLSGKADVALLLNPTDISALEKAAQLNETMPQKSTYFYPKIPSGAVIYSFL